MKQHYCWFAALCAVLMLPLQLSAQNTARPNLKGPAGLEVNTYSGNLYYKNALYALPGPGGENSLAIGFVYNSQSTANDFGYGYGWTSSFNTAYEFVGSDVLMRYPDGSSDLFTWNGSGYDAPTGIYDVLEEYAPNEYRLTTLDGMVMEFSNGEHKRITSITDRNGNTQSITYDGSGYPQTITDPCGRMITLTFSGGQLTTIDDPSTTPARQVSLGYDAFGNLQSITDPNGHTISYTYDVNRNMTQLQDARGSLFNIGYDASGRVSSLTNALSTTTIAYGLPVNTVTQHGAGTTRDIDYTFDGLGRLVQIDGACCGMTEAYTYDAQNNMTSMTDANGNVTTMTYDALGNMLTVTDALLNTITMTYEPASDRLSSVTDARGNTTNYSYDGSGNMVTVNQPLGITRSYSYDAQGNLLTETDGEGNMISYSYDACGNRNLVQIGTSVDSRTYDGAGNLLSSTNALNQTTTYTYDLMNEMLTMTTPGGCVKTMSYDANYNMDSETDGNNAITTYTFDILDRQTRATLPDGTYTETVYNEYGEEIELIDAMGNSTQQEYDSQGRLVKLTDALGNFRTYSYDANGNTTQETDFDGGVTSYEYDDVDRLTKMTDALNYVRTYAYDANGNEVSITEADGTVTTGVYDELNRVTQISIGGLTVAQFSYDANGKPLSLTDGENRTYTYTYDDHSMLQQVDGPLGYQMSIGRDAAGQLTSITRPGGLVESYGYDVDGNQTSYTDAEGELTLYTYDCNGNVLTESGPGGNLITTTYDALNRPTQVSDLLGTIESYTYNDNSQVLTHTDALNNVTQYEYDALDRLTGVTDPMGVKTTIGYDQVSNVVSEERCGQTISYLWDLLRRMTSRTDASGNVQAMTYDCVGNLLTQTDAELNETAYTYDNRGNRLTEEFADGSVRSFTYNNTDQLTTITDPGGGVTTLAYDELGRMETRDYPGANDDVFTYNAAGLIATATNNDASLSFTYDARGRLTSETLNGLTTTVSYDDANRIKSISYPSGRAIDIQADIRYRPTAIKESGVTLVANTFNAADLMTSRSYPVNGTSMAATLDAGGRITSLVHNPLAFVDFAYSYNCQNMRDYIIKGHRPTHSESMTHDATGQLTNHQFGTDNSGVISPVLQNSDYTYTASSDRATRVVGGTTTTYTNNNMHEYSGIVEGGVPRTPVYDVNGNRTSDGSNSFAYNGAHRLMNINGGSTAAYKYDPLGRRIEKTTAAGTVKYYYLDNNVIEERDGSGTVQATYVYGIESDEVLSMRRGGQDYYYHADALGSIVAVTDNSGNVVERYEYDPYGAVTIYDASYTVRSASAVGNPYMFAGRRYDEESGLYYNRLRYYDPEDGRFLRRDPLGVWGDPANAGNAYAYVNNSPGDFVDPSGMIRRACRRVGNWINRNVVQPTRRTVNRIVTGTRRTVNNIIRGTRRTVNNIIRGTRNVINRVINTTRRIVNAGARLIRRVLFPERAFAAVWCPANRRLLLMRFTNCNAGQQRMVREAICHSLRISTATLREMLNFVFRRGTAAQQATTRQRLRDWFGLSDNPAEAFLQTLEISAKIARIHSGFNQVMHFVCKGAGGNCGATTAAWYMIPGARIRLCPLFFTGRTADPVRWRGLVIYHEMTHWRASTLDWGYLNTGWDVNQAANPADGFRRSRWLFFGPTVQVNLRPWQMRNNADSYEGFASRWL